jgi:hypothetical protein
MTPGLEAGFSEVFCSTFVRVVGYVTSGRSMSMGQLEL